MSETLDKAALLERFDGDLEFLAETVDLYNEESATLLGEARKAVAGGDGAGLARAAHALRGMVGNFLAETASEAAQKLETMGNSGDLAGADEGLAALERETEQLKTELAKLRQGA